MKNNFSLVLALALSFALLPASAAPNKSAGNSSLKSAPPLSKSEGSTSALVSDSAMDKELIALETRFFFHHYSHDPVEKRLERLELMTLGGNQFGTTAERLANLKTAIVQRDKQSAQLMVAQKNKSDGPAKYPVLSTLEWRILKKTYAGETIDERLNRLESQLFGVPAQAMSYLDRIERLKTTAGVGSDSTIATTPGSLTERGVGPYTPLKRGPMPRAGLGPGALYGNLTENGSPFSRSPFASSATADSLFGDSDLAKDFEGEMDFGALSDKFTPNAGDIGNAGRARGWAGQEILIHIGPDGTSRTVRNFGPNGSTTLGRPEVSDNVLEQMQKPMLDFLRQLGLPFGSMVKPGSSAPVPFEMPAPLPERVPESNSGLLVPKLNKKPSAREELPPYSDPNSI